MTDHTRERQPLLGKGAMFQVMSIMKIGITDDGMPCHFIEGDILGRQFGCCCNHHGMIQPFRVTDRPAQNLHAPQ